MKKDVTVYFSSHLGIYHWHLTQGKYAAGGSAGSLEEAESIVNRVIEGLSDVGTIQHIHKGEEEDYDFIEDEEYLSNGYIRNE